MKHFLSGLLLSVFLTAGCQAAKVTDVSFSDLIAAPYKDNHKMVRLHCYMNSGFEDNGIYASQADRGKAFQANFAHNHSLRRRLPQYAGREVIIVGTFHSRPSSHRHHMLNGKAEKYSGRIKVSIIE